MADYLDQKSIETELKSSIKSAFKKSRKSGQEIFYKLAADTGEAFYQSIKKNVSKKQIGAALQRRLMTDLSTVMSGMMDEADFTVMVNSYKAAADHAEEIVKKFKSGDLTKEQLVQMLQAEGVGIDLAETLAAEFINRINRGELGAEIAGALGDASQTFEDLLGKMKLSGMHKNIKSSVESAFKGIIPDIPGLSFIGNAVSEALGDIAADFAKQLFSDMKKAMIENIKVHWKRWAGILIAISIAFSLMKKLNDVTDDIGKSFGAIGVQEFRADLISATAEAQKMGLGIAEVTTIVDTLSTEFGVAFENAIGMAGSVADTATALGISATEASNLVGTFMNLGGLSSDTAQNLLKQTYALSASAGVAPQQVLKDMAGQSEFIAGWMNESQTNISKAAVQARRMGLELSDVSSIAEGLLDFENSINKEMTASIMLGKRINLQRARQLALSGDLEGSMNEILSQLGGEQEFLAMNYLERKAIADMLGIGVDKAAKMAMESGKTREELMGMRAMSIEELVGENAIGGVTRLTNQLKSLGTQLLLILTPIGDFTGWIADMMEGSSMFIRVVTGLAVVFGVLTAALFVFKGAAFVAGLGWSSIAKIMGTSAPAMLEGGTAAYYASGAMLAMGTAIAMAAVGIGYGVKLIGDGISSIIDSVSGLIASMGGGSLFEKVILGLGVTLGILVTGFLLFQGASILAGAAWTALSSILLAGAPGMIAGGTAGWYVAGAMLAMGAAIAIAAVGIGYGIKLIAEGFSSVVESLIGVAEVGLAGIGVLFGLGAALYGLSFALSAVGVAGTAAWPVLAMIAGIGVIAGKGKTSESTMPTEMKISNWNVIMGTENTTLTHINITLEQVLGELQIMPAKIGMATSSGFITKLESRRLGGN